MSPFRIIKSKILPILLLVLLTFSMTNSISVSSSNELNDSNEINLQRLQVDQTEIEINQNGKDDSGLVKILNYNTQNAGGDPTWVDVIRRENPDIFLQVETGFIENIEPWRNKVNSFFPDETPYEVAAFDGTSNTDGQAIYSRYPIISTEVVDVVMLDDGTEHTINHPIMHAVVEIENIEVNILVNHLSCCDQFPLRLIEQEGVINYMDSLGDVPILYGGDFNSDSPQDIGPVAPLQGSLGSEPIGMMLNNSHPHGPDLHEFTDTYRTLNPDRKGYTLNSEGEYFSIDHFRGRIDYIFVNQHLTDYMVNSSVVDGYDAAKFASDHKPMYTWFNFKADEVDWRPPIAPQNVKVNVSAQQATLTWENGTETDLTHYNIYRNNSMIGTVNVDQTNYTDGSDYFDDEIYKYHVTAVDNSSNEGRGSLPVYVDPDFGQLYRPLNVSIETTSIPGGVQLHVLIGNDSNLPIESVKVYKALRPNDVFIIDSQAEGTTINVTLREDFTLYYKVAVVNSIGESDLSAPVAGVGGPSIDTEPEVSDTSDENGASLSLIVMIAPAFIALMRRSKSTKT